MPNGEAILPKLQADERSTFETSTFPKEEQVSLRRLSEYLRDQYEKACALRKVRDVQWIAVRSIMHGIHYFDMKGGVWQPVRKKPGQIKPQVPFMRPRYERQRGRILNPIGVTAAPRAGDHNDFYAAERAQYIMEAWLDESRFHEVDEESIQHLLYFGGYAYHWYPDRFRQQIAVRSIPQTDIVPIPFDAKCPRDADGFMVIRHVTKQWLENQDMKRMREVQALGIDPSRLPRMIDKSGTMRHGMAVGRTLGTPNISGGEMEGATTMTIWMKPNEIFPNGQYIFMVDDRIFVYQNDENTLPGGEVPLEFVYYVKDPDDFWGYGFCEQQIGPQREANRQAAAVLKVAIENRPINFYDNDVIDPKDVHGEDTAWVPIRDRSYDDKRMPAFRFDPVSFGRDAGITLELVKGFADEAAGFDSPIVFGRQSGRTDGAPATNILNTNAEAPLRPVLQGKWQALRAVFRNVLDMLPTVWPDSKTITAVGRGNIGREMVVSLDQVKASRNVILSPTPLLVEGTGRMINVLASLKQTPNQDGIAGGLISDSDYLRSLEVMGIRPPGISLTDGPEQRIAWRIDQLIGDGQQPRIPPYGSPGTEHLVIEDHRKAMQMLQEKIVDPAYNFYSPQVKKALLDEFQAHRQALNPQPVNAGFDDQLARQDAAQSEAILDAAEQSPETLDGIFSIHGLPVGV